MHNFNGSDDVLRAREKLCTLYRLVGRYGGVTTRVFGMLYADLPSHLSEESKPRIL